MVAKRNNRTRGWLERVRLFLAGSGEDRSSQPIGLGLARFTDCSINFGELIRAKSRGDEFPQGFAPRLLWSADFLSHAKKVSVTRKLFLQEDNLCVTNIQVSNEILLSSGKVAGTAAGESELTNSQPVLAGASQIESEMKLDSVQVRSLAIEATGDFFHKKLTPKIRLTGRWLERAGFLPGHRVEVSFEQPGTLTLRFVQQGREAAL